MRVVGKVGGGQRVDELTIDRRDLEVEAGHVAMHRELRAVHLMADRAHRAVSEIGRAHV